MNPSHNLKKIQDTIPSHVKLVAVSKTKSPEQILEVYQAGQRLFGESKIQELLPKAEQLPEDIIWHMIGHMQTNKVKYIAPFIDLIHSVDSMKLLQVINKEAAKSERIISCLLQFHIAEEETKFGLSVQEAEEILDSEAFKKMQHIQIAGVMGMATFTEDHNQVKKEFLQLKKYFQHLKDKYFTNDPNFCEISMGMSQDYLIAIEAGSTIVRVGSAIFGER
ncbi:MAG: YggS family pyridoxal phosphate-dependent enzyme [Bacteroidales bacterium]